ncbi:MAG: lipase family alpha/beta hydrolase [Planctomycetota bacterium]
MIVCSVVAGCSADRPMNPSFAVPMAEAKAILRGMREDPKPLDRPLVVLGGIHDPGFIAGRVTRAIRRAMGPDDLVTAVSFTGRGMGTFDGCRDHLIESVQSAYGATDGPATVEVDVIAFSMGGLVARHAARPRDDGGTQLNVRRLFTISSPHRGARMAGLPTLDRRAVEMRPGSEFLTTLDFFNDPATTEIYTYTRLSDMIVGAENTAPPGRHSWWVANPPFALAHLGAPHDPRIMADILRRLRGEEPLATLPAAAVGASPARDVGDNGTFDGSGGAPGT